MVNKNTAARKIQRVFRVSRRYRPREDPISYNPILPTNTYYLFPRGKKRPGVPFVVNKISQATKRQLKKPYFNPFSRHPLRKRNIVKITRNGKSVIAGSISNSNSNRSNSNSNSNSNSVWNNVRLSNNTIISNMRSILRNMQTPPRPQTLRAMVRQFTRNQNQISRVVNALERRNNNNANFNRIMNANFGGGLSASNYAAAYRMGHPRRI